jgi:hypothetical protein
MTYTEYVEQAEQEIRYLDDKIERLYDKGLDAEALEYTKQWREANQKLNEYIAKHRKKVSSLNMKNKQNW